MPENFYHPIVKISGTELDSAQYDALLDIDIESGVRSISRAIIRIADPGYELSAVTRFAALDADCTVTDADGASLFGGVIVERAVSHTEHHDTVLELVALDHAHQLAKKSHAEARRGTLSDMIERLAAAHGLTTSLPQDATIIEWAALTGTAASIIDEIAERYGYDWMTVAKKLHVWDAATGAPTKAGPVPLALGVDMIDFGLRVSSSRQRQVEVRGWDDTQQKSLTATGEARGSRSSAKFLPAADSSPPVVKRTDLAPVTQADADKLAKAAASTGDRTIARGRAMLNAAIAPGVTVNVTQAGVSSGNFYVREVKHHFSASGSWTRFVAGDRDAPRLAEPWSAPQRSSTFSHDGATIGIVTQVDTETPRVKVKLPVIADQFESGWARVLMLGAGDKTGLFVMPEVNDEVVVVFAEGNLQSPVVIGGLHSTHNTRTPGSTPVPRDSSSKVAARTWFSKLGHFIELRDDSAAAGQHVKLGLGNGDQYVRVGKDKVEISAPSNVPIRIGNKDAWIEIADNGAITIEATSLQIKTRQDVLAEGANIEIKAKATVKVEANAELGLKANGKASLESSGQTVVKGTMVQIN